MAEFNTEADLLRLVAEAVEENLHLDFKASPSLAKGSKERNELSKDVSAFANSAGGTLLYGVVEDRTTHTAASIDAGYDPANITKEWIEQVIDTNLSPRIEGLIITPIPLVTINPGRVAYSIEIPASDRAPHMANDNRYYLRQNFQSVPMEDYQVRDILGRRRGPDLEIECRVTPCEDDVLLVEFSIANIGSVLAEQAYIRVSAETSTCAPGDKWRNPLQSPYSTIREEVAPDGKPIRAISYIQSPGLGGRTASTAHLPPLIYPGLKFNIHMFGIYVRGDASPQAALQIQVFARDMPGKTRVVTIRELRSLARARRR